MSEKNLETARRGYEHFIATGEVLEEDIHRDFVLDLSTFRGWPERHRYEGIAGYREFISDWFGTWDDDWEFDVTELRQLDDGRVLALIEHRGRSKESGVPVEMKFAHILSFEDGLQVGLKAYASHAEGLEAAGLAPES